MKKALIRFAMIIPLVLFICFTLSCQKQTEEEKLEVDVEADIVAINEIWIQYAGSFNSGDLDSWISLWTDNGIQMAPDDPAVIGKEQIRAKYESIFPQFIFKMAIANEEVRVAGDLAFSRGNYTFSMTPKAGGETIEIDGKYLTILERQTDGSWRILRDCFNSDVPPK